MISFTISVVPPKFHGIRGLPQELLSSGARGSTGACSTGGYSQDVAGEIDEVPPWSGARPRTVVALSIAIATWLATAPMRYRSAAA